jgi:hypothetical protein
MNKKIYVMAFAFLAFLTAGTVFAETLQCRDPDDGSITVNFMGSSVSTTYSGKSAQTFQVVVLLADDTTEYLTFSYERVNRAQTRSQHQQARGPIKRVTNCSFVSY